MNALTLYELNGLVRQALQLTLDTPYWVRAEISELRTNRHCYIELVQKDDYGSALTAKARAQIWANRWFMLSAMFERATGQRLAPGLQVMVQVEVMFHELYGYSLNIINIDPTYTLGDIAKRRREIMQQLKEEGVIDMNKELPLPRLLQRVAVISSASAAGYGDFCNQLHNNRKGLAFVTQLFQANMQGANTDTSIIAALNRIAAQADLWDIVVITRGGGATSDLNCFDSLQLAENVAQFPLPIITGIGHERDDTVIDMVAHTRVKTPTAAAEFLIHHQETELDTLENIYENILSEAATMLTNEKNHLKTLSSQLPLASSRFTSQARLHLMQLLNNVESLCTQITAREDRRIEAIASTLPMLAPMLLNKEKARLQMADVKISSADPQRILNLGFSITRINGKAVRDASHVKEGDEITTTLAYGTIISYVKTSKTEISKA